MTQPAPAATAARLARPRRTTWVLRLRGGPPGSHRRGRTRPTSGATRDTAFATQSSFARERGESREMPRRDSTPLRFHAFQRLVLTITESSIDGVSTDLVVELRSVGGLVEVWRSSTLVAGGDTCSSGERCLGTLAPRHVVELLEEIERSGIYEALPALGIVDGAASDELAPRASMRVESASRRHDVMSDVPADAVVVGDVVRAVRERVELAQERALTRAG